MTTTKVALVTGAARGIGNAIAQRLSNAGWQVIASDLDEAAIGEAVESFETDRGPVTARQMDVTDRDSINATIKAITDEFGQLDVLINNAGITRDGMFHKMTPEQWKEVIDTNLSGLFNMTHPIFPGMRERGFGRIVNISSINGQKGQAGQVNYSAAKAGDVGFTRALAQEGAFKGVTVNAICPGYIGTEMVRKIPQEVLDKKIIPQIPVGRLGEPEEIARCVVFLASDDAGFLTGSTISPNGGQFFS